MRPMFRRRLADKLIEQNSNCLMLRLQVTCQDLEHWCVAHLSQQTFETIRRGSGIERAYQAEPHDLRQIIEPMHRRQ